MLCEAVATAVVNSSPKTKNMAILINSKGLPLSKDIHFQESVMYFCVM